MTPTSFPPVPKEGSLFSPTQKALGKSTVQACHYHLTHHCLHTFLHQTYLWFQGFQHKLIFGSRLSITYPHPICHSSLAAEASIPASDHLVQPSAITQLSDFPKSILVLSFILPFLLLLLISSRFFCVNFSVSPISELTSGS